MQTNVHLWYFQGQSWVLLFPKKGTTKSKEDTSNSKHATPKSPQQIQVFNGMA
jgi:hypothetical protein